MATALELNLERPSGDSNSNGHAAGAPRTANPAAVRAASDLLDRLYDHGVLDFMRGLAGAGGEIASKLAEGADSEQSLRAIRNGLSLLSILASIDPALLQGISKSWTEASGRHRDNKADPPGMWSLLRRMTSRESRRALATILDGLEAMGRMLE